MGDNVNDLWIMREAGLGIAFDCKSDSLAVESDALVEVKDLRAILPLVSGDRAEK